MKNKQNRWAAAATAALLLTLSVEVALPVSYVEPTDAKMVEAADVIAAGRVARVELDPTSTTVALEVAQCFKGACSGDGDQFVEFRFPGGSSLVLPDMPKLAISDELLVFLRAAPEGGGLRLVALGLGAVDVDLDGPSTQPLVTGESSLDDKLRARYGLAAPAPSVHSRAVSGLEYRLMQPPSKWRQSPEIAPPTVAMKGLTAEASRAAVQGAITEWAANSGLGFDVVAAEPSAGFVCTPGRLSISWDDPLGEVGHPDGACWGGVLAIGGFCPRGGEADGFSNIMGGSVVMASGWETCTFWTPTNVTEVLTHEIGHAVGLAHSCEGNCGTPIVDDATMYLQAHFDGRGEHLEEYDKGAIGFLYPATATPTAAPATPTASPAPSITIGGGGQGCTKKVEDKP